MIPFSEAAEIGTEKVIKEHSTIGIVMAACLLVILPMLIMYCILQKQFIKSIDRVGIVG